MVRKQTVQPGNSDVTDLLDLISHDIGGYGSFFGYRQIARSGTNNTKQAMASLLMVAMQNNTARNGME
jgi:hypothetical protein